MLRAGQSGRGGPISRNADNRMELPSRPSRLLYRNILCSLAVLPTKEWRADRCHSRGDRKKMLGAGTKSSGSHIAAGSSGSGRFHDRCANGLSEEMGAAVV